MRKVIRQVVIALIFIIVITGMSIVAFAVPNIPEATREFYVNDFANVFTQSERIALMNRAVEFAETTDGIQIVITTVESLDGNTVEDYANAMYNQYEIGRNDMGLLILLSTGDREIRVETGQSMEAYVNDAKAGRFTDNYAIPKLRDNKFNEGLISLQTELINEIKVCIERANTPAEVVQVKEEKLPREPIVINWGAIGLVVLIIAILGIFVLIGIILYKKTKKIEELEQEISEITAEHEEAMLKEAGKREKLRELHGREMDQERKRANSAIEVKRQELSQIRDELDDSVKQEKDKNRKLSDQISTLDRENSAMAKELDTLQDRYNRVNILYPSADQDVTQMIEDEIRAKDMAIAAEADARMTEVLAQPADKSIIQSIRQAQNAYNDLSDTQKQYVKSDNIQLNELYIQSMQLQHQFSAAEAVSAITAVIAEISIGKEAHIRELNRANSTYSNLDREAKEYVDKSIPEKISSLLSQAEQDKKDREEREEEDRKRKLASEAVAAINAILSRIAVGKEKYINDLIRAESIYDKLSREVQKYVDKSIPEKISSLLSQAKKDKKEREEREEEEKKRKEEERRRREREEEERRRRNSINSFNSSNSSSSSFSSSSHSGFGGRSGGGGASRKF